MKKKPKLLKIEITWSKRTAKVTSLTGGHVATCLDLGDKMEIGIRATAAQPGDTAAGAE